MQSVTNILCSLLLACVAVGAAAHGIKPREQQFPAGVPVTAPLTASDTARAVGLTVSDTGWPTAVLVFDLDETITFRLRNNGSMAHMFVIGNAPGQRDQALMHRLMPGDEHDYPNTRHLPPGTETRLDWRFNRAGRFSIRCLVPEHQNTESITPVEVRASP